jgi:hypothetical protein
MSATYIIIPVASDPIALRTAVAANVLVAVQATLAAATPE